jgi:hypothetical protein
MLAILRAFTNILVAGGAGPDTVGFNVMLMVAGAIGLNTGAGRRFVDSLLLARWPSAKLLAVSGLGQWLLAQRGSEIPTSLKYARDQCTARSDGQEAHLVIHSRSGRGCSDSFVHGAFLTNEIVASTLSGTTWFFGRCDS